MNQLAPLRFQAEVTVDHVTRFDPADLDALTEATKATIDEGSQSSWRGRPSHERLSAFWKGVALSPHRHLIVGKANGRPAGAVQVVQSGPLSEVGPEVATLDNFFVAPDVRGFGMARRLVRYAEDVARAHGIESLDLCIREDRIEAIALFEELGYRQWGRKDTFRKTDLGFQAGLYYGKRLSE